MTMRSTRKIGFGVTRFARNADGNYQCDRTGALLLDHGPRSLFGSRWELYYNPRHYAGGSSALSDGVAAYFASQLDALRFHEAAWHIVNEVWSAE